MRILVVVIEVEINTVLLNDKNLTAESQHRVEFRITERDEGFCMPSERHGGLLRGGQTRGLCEFNAPESIIAVCSGKPLA
jgi:hypothetical protein